MKKIFAIITLFALVFTSCQKDEMMFMGSGLDTITATIESTNDTKASLDGNYNVVWNEDDKISVFIEVENTVLNVQYTLSSVNNNGTGVFTKTSDLDITGGTIIAAFYPYTENAKYEDGTITGVGTVVQGTYSTTPVAPRMAAKVESGTNISFKNIGAIVKVTTPNIPTTYSVVQLSSATSYLSGSCSINFDNGGTPVVSPSATGSQKFVTFIETNTQEAQAGGTQSFYFPVFAGNYSDLTVKAIGGESYSQELVLIAPKALTAERSKLYYTDATLTTYNSNEVALTTSATEQNIEIITTTEQQQITVAEAEGQSVTGQVNISINSSDTKTLTLNLPSSTVLLSGTTTYSQITASTAENTLILGNGVTVTKVIVNKGNVQVNEGATLNGIELGTGVTSATIIDNGGVINITELPQGVKKMSAAEFALRQAIEAGGSIILNNDITLSSYLTFTKDATLNLNGKNITANGLSFYVTGGTLTIEGEGIVTSSANNNNNQAAVWAATNGSVIINGGTYTVGTDANGNTNDCIYANGGTITINNGTFSNKGTYDPAAGGVVINAHNSKENSKVIINGGTFKPADGCVPYEVADVVNGRIVLNSVANESELKIAIEAGGDVNLGADIALTSYLTFTKDATLNLNGKNITANGLSFYVTGGTLTIEGEGIVTSSANNNNNQAAVWAATNGSVIINGGTYTVGTDANGNTNDCIYANGGTITINNGTFSNKGTYDPAAGGVVINAHNSKENSKVIINGGTFKPADGCVPYEDADVNAGRVVISTSNN